MRRHLHLMREGIPGVTGLVGAADQERLTRMVRAAAKQRRPAIIAEQFDPVSLQPDHRTVP